MCIYQFAFELNLQRLLLSLLHPLDFRRLRLQLVCNTISFNHDQNEVQKLYVDLGNASIIVSVASWKLPAAK